MCGICAWWPNRLRWTWFSKKLCHVHVFISYSKRLESSTRKRHSRRHILSTVIPSKSLYVWHPIPSSYLFKTDNPKSMFVLARFSDYYKLERYLLSTSQLLFLHLPKELKQQLMCLLSLSIQNVAMSCCDPDSLSIIVKQHPHPRMCFSSLLFFQIYTLPFNVLSTSSLFCQKHRWVVRCSNWLDCCQCLCWLVLRTPQIQTLHMNLLHRTRMCHLSGLVCFKNRVPYFMCFSLLFFLTINYLLDFLYFIENTDTSIRTQNTVPVHQCLWPVLQQH